MTRAVVAAAAILAAQPALAGKKALGPNERIDVNHASAAELMRLPGVGRVRAERITARRAHAPFQRLEELASVKGVGKAWLEKNRAHLTVGTPAAQAGGAAPGGSGPAPRPGPTAAPAGTPKKSP